METAYLQCQLFLDGLQAHEWWVVPRDSDCLEGEGLGGIGSMQGNAVGIKNVQSHLSG